MVDAMEFRQVKAGDGAWLSPHNKDPADATTDAYLGIHISFNGDPTLRKTIQEDFLPVLEQALHPYGARPHWGKLGTPKLYCYSRLQELYGKEALDQFQKLCQKHDPSGKFRNEFLQKLLFGKE